MVIVILELRFRIMIKSVNQGNISFMSKRLQQLLLLLFCIPIFGFAQDLEKMNKKELKEYAQSQEQKNSILETQLENLENMRSALNDRISKMQASEKESTAEIQKLTKDRTAFLNEIATLKQQQEVYIQSYDNQIAKLRDSIAEFRTLLDASPFYSASDPNDFLNDYFFSSRPLGNITFQMVSSKVIFGDVGYNDSYYSNEVVRLPEVLESNAFKYWVVKPNQKVISNTNFNDYVNEQAVAYLNSRLPKIQILNNKFLSIYYPDGSEEAFLFTARKLDSENNNNNRTVLEFDLEGVDDGNENADISWRLFAIGADCYLALSVKQLQRLKIDIRLPSKGLEVYDTDGDIRSTSSFDSYYKYTTTGNGIYMSRKKDLYMEEAFYSDPEKMVFLFKLK